MTTRIHSEIRKLALAYYRGWIPREDYLSLRRDYLQAISDGKTPSPVDPKKIAAPKQSSPSSNQSTDKKKKNTLLIIVIAIIAIILIVAGIMIGQPEKQTSLPSPQKNTSQTSTGSTATPSTVNSNNNPQLQHVTDEQRFVNYLEDQFVNKHKWNIDSLNNIKLKWLGLSQEQQRTARQSNEFKSFTSALAERIMDERELNNIVPSDHELTLMTVAKNLGISQEIPGQ